MKGMLYRYCMKRYMEYLAIEDKCLDIQTSITRRLGYISKDEDELIKYLRERQHYVAIYGNRCLSEADKWLALAKKFK